MSLDAELLAALERAVLARNGNPSRRVNDKGVISFSGRRIVLSKGFIGQPVALRAVGEARWEVYFCHQRIGIVDLTQPYDV